MSDIPTVSDARLQQLLIAYANANFDCGAYDADDQDWDDMTYEELSAKVCKARSELFAEINRRLVPGDKGSLRDG